MKKKLISLTLLAAMLFSLAACSSGNVGSQNDSGSQQESDGGKSGNSDVLKVTVAAQPTSGQVFQFIAEEHGFNEEEGNEPL